MAYLQCDWVLEKAGKASMVVFCCHAVGILSIACSDSCLVNLQMLFLDLTEGCLAPYSLRLYQPSKYAVCH